MQLCCSPFFRTVIDVEIDLTQNVNLLQLCILFLFVLGLRCLNMKKINRHKHQMQSVAWRFKC